MSTGWSSTPQPLSPLSQESLKKENSSLTKKKVWKSSVVYVLRKLCLGIESIEEFRQCTNIRPVLDRFGIRRVLPDEQRSVHSLPVSFFDPTLSQIISINHCTPTSPNYHSCRTLCFSNVLARLLIVNLEDSALQFPRTCISSCVVERKAYLDSCEKGCVWFWTILSCAMSCQNHKFTFEHPPLLHPPFLSLSLLSLSSVYFAWTILTAPGTIRTQ